MSTLHQMVPVKGSFVRNERNLDASIGKASASAPQKVPEESRKRIKKALDDHFDDGVGQYLDGMSDQKVGDTLNVPRIWVEFIRDAAFGPIRVTPQIIALRSELAAHQSEIEKTIQAVTVVESAAKAFVTTLKDLWRQNEELSAKIEALVGETVR